VRASFNGVIRALFSHIEDVHWPVLLEPRVLLVFLHLED